MNVSVAVTPSREKRILILGYGDPGRQDDGLGPAVAAGIDLLGWPGVSTLDACELKIEDAMDVAAHDIVWFVDAASAGPAPFAVHEVAPARDVKLTSHSMRPETIMAIAGQCYGGAPRAFLLAVRGYAFKFTEALTPRATDNLRAAVALLNERIRAAQTEPGT